MLLIALAIAVSTGAGLWAERRNGPRAARFSRGSLRFVLYVLLPPVAYFNLARAELNADAGLGIVIAVASLVVATTIAWFVCSRILHLSRPATGSVMCCVLVANTGYLGYPATAALLGLDELSKAVIYDVLVAGPALIIGAFSVGAAFGDRAGEGVRQRVRAFFARNPVLYAAGLALVVPDTLAPDLLVDVSRIAVVAILPIGFFALGVSLGEESDEGSLPIPPPFGAAVAIALAARFAAVPLLLLVISAPLIELPDAYLLMAAMPCGINSLIVTHIYGLDLRVTSAAVAWSTVLAVLAAALVPLVA